MKYKSRLLTIPGTVFYIRFHAFLLSPKPIEGLRYLYNAFYSKTVKHSAGDHENILARSMEQQ